MRVFEMNIIRSALGHYLRGMLDRGDGRTFIASEPAISPARRCPRSATKTMH
jgi:hypothetical protein